MAFLPAIIPLLIEGATAAGSAIAGAAGAVGSAVGALSTGEILQGGFSVLSAISSIGGAEQDAAAQRAQAAQEKLNATQEEIAGRQKANELTDQLIDRLAQGRVSFAANNVDLGQGVGTQFATGADARANDALVSNERQFNSRALARRSQAKQLLAQADSTELGGYASALGTLATTAGGFANRG